VFSTDVFIFTQRQIVVLYTGTSARRYMPVYSKTLTLNKGVDNAIQFQFLNQGQKSVDITGMTLTFRILDQTANKVILSKALALTLPLTGIATLTVEEAELEDLDSQRCYYTIEYTSNSGAINYPAYMDQLAGARGDIVIADGVMPKFLPCQEVSIPSGQLFPNNEMYMSQCTVMGLQSQALKYYSSTVTTYDNPVLTFQASYTGFSGNVVIEGAVTNDSTSWYPITTAESYTTLTDTRGYSITGYHPYVRMAFSSWAGSVENILVR
jgi:hypothetical protein